MTSYADLLRQLVAYLLLVVAAAIFLVYFYRNLQLTLENMRGKRSLVKNKRLPLRFGILTGLSVLLAVAGIALLVPWLEPLVPSAVAVALVIGVLVWVNLHFRFRVAERFIFHEAEQAEKDQNARND